MKVLVAARDVRVRRPFPGSWSWTDTASSVPRTHPDCRREPDAQFDAHVRDHLADHPDHLLAAWIAGRRFPTR